MVSSSRTCTLVSFVILEIRRKVLIVYPRKNGGKSVTATKGGGRAGHGKQASYFVIRFVVAATTSAVLQLCWKM